MKNLKLFFVVVFLLFVGASCTRKSPVNFEGGSVSYEMDASAIKSELPPPPPPPAAYMMFEKANNLKTTTTTTTKIDKRKIIKDGRIDLTVNDLKLAKLIIDSLVKRNQAYYAEENFGNNYDSYSFTLKIRIPASNFESFIFFLESLKGEITYKAIKAQDVTEEYVDLETRLKNKRNYLKRYNDLLSMAKSVKDILEIEENTRKIEEEIESAEGRLKLLNDQVNYSTLDINLLKKKDFVFQPEQRGSFIERFKQSCVKGWYGFVDFVLGLFLFWPVLILLLVLFLIIRYLIKKSNKKAAQKKSKEG